MKRASTPATTQAPAQAVNQASPARDRAHAVFKNNTAIPSSGRAKSVPQENKPTGCDGLYFARPADNQLVTFLGANNRFGRASVQEDNGTNALFIDPACHPSHANFAPHACLRFSKDKRCALGSAEKCPLRHISQCFCPTMLRKGNCPRKVD